MQGDGHLWSGLTRDITHATDKNMSDPDWALNLKICDGLNSLMVVAFSQGYRVLQVLQKRVTSKKDRVGILALVVPTLSSPTTTTTTSITSKNDLHVVTNKQTTPSHAAPTTLVVAGEHHEELPPVPGLCQHRGLRVPTDKDAAEKGKRLAALENHTQRSLALTTNRVAWLQIRKPREGASLQSMLSSSTKNDSTPEAKIRQQKVLLLVQAWALVNSRP